MVWKMPITSPIPAFQGLKPGRSMLLGDTIQHPAKIKSSLYYISFVFTVTALANIYSE